MVDSAADCAADFTVAIPTYNGEGRLPDVLDCLRSQVNPAAITWEILVVDNRSQDDTAALVRSLQASFPVPLRYVLECQQGAAYARRRAIQDAASPLIGFLDDDNLPDANWVAEAYQFAQQHARAGAIASRIRGEFEVEPPAGLRRILPFLALTDRGAQPLRYLPSSPLLPPSAGLVVRKQSWQESVPEQTVLGGRTVGNMLTGEDLEVLAYIQRSGWEIWYNPAMTVAHKIPAWRLERSYLIPFFRGIGLSRYVTRTAGIQRWQRPVVAIAYLANDVRKIVVHWLKYHLQRPTDLAAACEMELLISSLKSPWYWWTKCYLRPRR